MEPEARRAPGEPASAGPALRRALPLLLVLLVAAGLLLADLGGPRLWADEGDTAVFARNIVDSGLPRAWDGRTFIDSDRGERIDANLVMVGTPWLPFYVTAASFAVFGESAWSARLPFALAGLAAVALLHALVLRLTGDRRAALAAALLLALNPQFLLYARECRHYALNMLLTLGMLAGFLRLAERPRELRFVLCTVLLYHAHPLPAGANLAALGALTLVHPGFAAQRRAFWLRLPIVLALTLPWMVFSWGGVKENSTLLPELAQLPARLAQFGIEATVAVPVPAWLALGWLARAALRPGDRRWLTLALLPCAAYAALLPAVLSTYQLWGYGLRYVCGILPLAAGVSGVLVARASGGRAAPAAALVALLAFTHLGGNSLFWIFSKGGASPAETGVCFHTPQGALHKLLRTDLAGFVRGLVEPNPGSVSHIVDYLRRHAQQGDILITNYAWEPIYFHTDLPQGWKVTEKYSIYPAARDAGLPEYVFGVTDARWVVWRAPWEDYPGYGYEDVREALRQRGQGLELVHNFPETVWENRPELHFHRFPGFGVLYPYPEISALQRHGGVIFRVRPAAAR